MQEIAFSVPGGSGNALSQPVTAANPLPVTSNQISPLPAGAVEKGSSSADVAATAAVATLTATAAKTNRLTAVIISGLGATAAGAADLTITGLLGGTMTIPIAVPALPAGLQPIVLSFPGGLPGSAVNTAIVVTLASLGAGNTEAAVSAFGYAV